MSGLRLAEMDASDMLDVLHFFFEDDLRIKSAEEAEAISESRSVIYSSLYGTTYKYGMKKSSRSFSADGSSLPDDGYFGDDIQPFDPSETNVRKPFIPATEFDADSPLPFGRDLDAPLG